MFGTILGQPSAVVDRALGAFAHGQSSLDNEGSLDPRIRFLIETAIDIPEFRVQPGNPTLIDPPILLMPGVLIRAAENPVLFRQTASRYLTQLQNAYNFGAHDPEITPLSQELRRARNIELASADNPPVLTTDELKIFGESWSLELPSDSYYTENPFTQAVETVSLVGEYRTQYRQDWVYEEQIPENLRYTRARVRAQIYAQSVLALEKFLGETESPQSTSPETVAPPA